MSTQEHDLQRKRGVGGEAGVRHWERGLKREGDRESYSKRRSEKEWIYEGKWRDERIDSGKMYKGERTRFEGERGKFRGEEN